MDKAPDDEGGAFLREAVDAGRNGGVGEALRSEFHGASVTVRVGGVKEIVLVALSTAPDRPDGVDDPLRREVARGRCDRLAGRQAVGIAFAPDLPALFKDRRAAGAVDGAVDAAAS